MNILYHHRTSASGAAGHHIREMVKAFQRLGHSIDIVSPPGVSVSIKTEASAPNKGRYRVPQIIFELIEIFYNCVAFFRISGQLKREKYGFIYERYAIFNLAGIAAAKIFKLPIILEASFTSFSIVFPKRTKILSPLAYLSDRIVFHNADLVVVVSNVLKEDLENKFRVPSDKILVLTNAVDAEMFDPDNVRSDVKQRYGLGSNQVVGFVGGFYPWHGLGILMDAAEKVLKTLPNTRFLLIGDGSERAEIEKRAKEGILKNAVIFTGPIPYGELPSYIASFDIGVMPDSNAYGSPMKIFEYMSMSKPVVAPKIRPIEEVINNGENGVLFDAKNNGQLADAIAKVLTDQPFYKKISDNSRETVVRAHTWVRNAEAILTKLDKRNKEQKKKEIRFVLQYFYPEVASTAQLMTELAEDLVKKGLRVKVLCGQPTYLRSQRLAPKEVYNGIEIERLPCTRFEKNSFIGRLLNWCSFTFLAFVKLLFSRDSSVLFIVSTPPFLFVVGYLLNIIRKQKYVCLIYDLYPEIMERLGYLKKGTLIAKIWRVCNKGFFNRAEYVIVPSTNMKRFVEQGMKNDNEKIQVIFNWSDGDFIKPLSKKENWFSIKHGLVENLTIVYSGNIGLFHQLETLIEAADRLRGKRIRFVFIGEGGKKKKLEEMSLAKGLDNVLFLPYQDKDILPYSLTCGDVSVVSLEKGLDCVAAPCKFYTSLSAGQIILGLVDDTSDVAKIVKEYECGFCVSQDDVEGVVEVLNKLNEDVALLKQYSINARKCFEDNFTKEKAMQRYFEVFSHV